MRMFKKDLKHIINLKYVDHNKEKKKMKCQNSIKKTKKMSTTIPLHIYTHTQTPNTTSINHVAAFVVCLFFHLFNFYTIKKYYNRTKFKIHTQNEKIKKRKKKQAIIIINYCIQTTYLPIFQTNIFLLFIYLFFNLFFSIHLFIFIHFI